MAKRNAAKTPPQAPAAQKRAEKTDTRKVPSQFTDKNGVTYKGASRRQLRRSL